MIAWRGRTFRMNCGSHCPTGFLPSSQQRYPRLDETLDELTCTTIHGFCQQLVKPYPVEAGIDPGATIIDPEAADLAYQDLVQAWLSARFGRDRGAEGLGRLPPLPALGEEDFFAELLVDEPDRSSSAFKRPRRFLGRHERPRRPLRPLTPDPRRAVTRYRSIRRMVRINAASRK